MPCFGALALVALYTQLSISRSQGIASAPRRPGEQTPPQTSSGAWLVDPLAIARASPLVASSALEQLTQSKSRRIGWEAAEARRLQEVDEGDAERGAEEANFKEGEEEEEKSEGELKEEEKKVENSQEEEEEEEKEVENSEEENEVDKEDEEEEEEEEEFTDVDIGISWMLLGSVAFTMLLFYLVNYGDDDIRRYSWSIISTTISIFTAVLMFGGINEFIVDLIPGGEWVTLLTGYILLLLWFTLTQVSIAFGSGLCARRGSYTPVETSEFVWVVADGMRADFGQPVDEDLIRNTSGSRSVAVVNRVEIFVHKKAVAREMRERQAKGFSILLAHMTGFAAISAGGNLQHVSFFEQNAGTALLAVAFNWGLLFTLSRITDAVRERCFVSSAGMEENAKLFDEEAEDAENDVASLSISFLTVQAFRFQLTGALPGVKPEVAQSFGCVQALYGAGLLCALGAVLLVVTQRGGESNRLLEVFQNVLGMSFAWCVLWATRWLALGWGFLQAVGCSPETMQGRVLLALVLSAMALIFIFVLDKVEDAAGGHTRLDRVIQNIVNALSILVGLSWEYCFDGGLEAVVSVTAHPLLIKLVFTFLVAMVILPAWKRYILVKIMTLNKNREEIRDARRAAGELTQDPTFGKSVP